VQFLSYLSLWLSLSLLRVFSTMPPTWGTTLWACSFVLSLGLLLARLPALRIWYPGTRAVAVLQKLEYHWIYAFLIGTTFLFLIVTPLVTADLHWSHMWALLNSLILSLISSLCVLHLFYCSKNMTTIEYIYKKHTYLGQRTFPYDLGALGNFKQLFGPNLIFWALPIPAEIRERVHLPSPAAYPLGQTGTRRQFFDNVSSVAAGNTSNAKLRWQQAIKTVRHDVRVKKIYNDVVVMFMGLRSVHDATPKGKDKDGQTTPQSASAEARALIET